MFDFRRNTAALAFALIIGAGALLALAAARGLAPGGEASREKLGAELEKMRAAQVAHAEAALKRQGGSRITLKLDADALREATLIGLRDDARRIMREQRIPLAGLATRDRSVEVRLREANDRERVLNALAPLAASASGAVEIAAVDQGLIRLTPTEAGLAGRVRLLRQESIDVIEQRLDSLGVAARGVQPDGPDGIRVVLPGVTDLERVTPMLSKRARVTFRLVDTSMRAEQALQGKPPEGSEVLYGLNDREPYLLLKQVAMDGADVADASPGFDQRTDQPIATFRFNPNGTRRFAQITSENIGRPFAIVLDEDVISVPVIREPILGGSGQISGSFTVKEANRIAMEMRSATLAGRLTVVAQQVVAPEARKD